MKKKNWEIWLIGGLVCNFLLLCFNTIVLKLLFLVLECICYVFHCINYSEVVKNGGK